MERANEIQETMGRSYAVPDGLDEDDLQAGQLSPQVNNSPILIQILHSLELDALSDMDENELSYLDDIKAQPDFLDEAPRVPSSEVSLYHISSRLSCVWLSRD
jgi:charged multivesicular body protein 5